MIPHLSMADFSMTLENTSTTPPAATQNAQRQLINATMLVAIGNFSSRLLGLAREVILSNVFGASVAVDAFKIAIIIPRGLYDLLIGGHVNSALIPVLSDYAENQKTDDLWRLVSALMNLAFIVMASLVLVIELLAPHLIRLVASDESSPQIIDEATRLLRITIPALLFLSLFAVLSSLLYALRKFALPAFATFFFNLTIVVVTLGLEERFGITAAAIGWLLGALIQLLLQGIGLRGLGGYLQLVFWHPAIRTIVLLYTPVMFSLALDVLVNRPISYNLASRTGEGSIAYMDWATTLREFPHGLVATAISIAVLPTLARQAADKLNPQAFKETLAFGLRLTLALIIPATIGLIVLATPIVALIFEHGAFTNTDTLLTSLALRLYMVGLPFASLDLLLVFAFYARQDTLTPALIGVVSLAAYMITAIFLLPQYSFFALMIADSVKHLVHATLCAWLLMRRIGWLKGHQLLQTAFRSTIAALVMGIMVTGLLILLRPALDVHTTLNESLLVMGAGLPSAIAYLMLANWLGVKEIQLFFQKATSRLYNKSYD